MQPLITMPCSTRPPGREDNIAVAREAYTSEGPAAGTETADPVEFLARVLVHSPDKGHVTKAT